MCASVGWLPGDRQTVTAADPLETTRDAGLDPAQILDAAGLDAQQQVV
jgi:hypothetical protein